MNESVCQRCGTVFYQQQECDWCPGSQTAPRGSTAADLAATERDCVKPVACAWPKCACERPCE